MSNELTPRTPHATERHPTAAPLERMALDLAVARTLAQSVRRSPAVAGVDRILISATALRRRLELGADVDLQVEALRDLVDQLAATVRR